MSEDKAIYSGGSGHGGAVNLGALEEPAFREGGEAADEKPPQVAADRRASLLSELRATINRHSVENASNTPDFLLAAYLEACLDAYAAAVSARDRWFGFNPWAKPTQDAR